MSTSANALVSAAEKLLSTRRAQDERWLSEYPAAVPSEATASVDAEVEAARENLARLAGSTSDGVLFELHAMEESARRSHEADEDCVAMRDRYLAVADARFAASLSARAREDARLVASDYGIEY